VFLNYHKIVVAGKSMEIAKDLVKVRVLAICAVLQVYWSLVVHLKISL